MPTELDVLPTAILKEAGEVEGCGPCSWLVGGQCKHYQHRPEVCRQFELGGEECLEIRRHAGLPSQ
jgi:Fe-S-cluster containining protein